MSTLASKKITLACAAALLCGGALAQTASMRISGFVDIGVYRNIAKTWTLGSLQISSLTVSGTEDLGGGYAAIFALTTRYEPDSGRLEDEGIKPFFHAESTLGLKGGFGSVQLGRRLDAVYNNDWHYDPWDYSDRVASPAWNAWHYNYPSDPQGNNGAAEYGRLNNGIFYESPRVRGVSLHLSTSPEKRDGDRRRPVAAALVWHGAAAWQAMASRAINSAGHTDRFFGLRAPAGALTLMGTYNISEAPTAMRAKTATLGGTYALGANTLKVGWGQVRQGGSKVLAIWGLGVHHALSKRSTLYVSLGRKKFAPQSGQYLYGVGISHAF